MEVGLGHTLPEVLAHAARRFGDKPYAIEADGTVTSFADFEKRVIRAGYDLLAAGIEPGDRVGVLAPNSTGWAVAASATMAIGAIMVPINTRFKGPEIRYALEKSGAAALFTVGAFLGTDYRAMVVKACGGPGQERPTADLAHLKAIIRIDDPGFAPAQITVAERTLYSEAAAQVTPQTTADILFTSGTTGMPKGAMHGHGQGLWMSLYWAWCNDLREDDCTAIVNPFFHSFGYRSGWVAALLVGMTMYPLATFDPGAMLELIERERISQLSGAPAVFFSLMQHPDFAKRDISSLRTGHTGGAKTPPDIIRAGYDTLGFDIFLTSYGQTESTAMISSNKAGDPLDAIIETVGRPIPGVEVRFVDADGQDVPEGDRGELLVRGPNVMQGYWRDPEQTRKTIDADGWLHTGDVSAIDANGRLRILDRLKDVIIVGGFNAYSVEIEIMLAKHPAISEVAIVGLPDERLGEVTAACVILKPAAQLTLDDLSTWARERMANYKVPRFLFVFDDFPRTPLGKVQKFELRKQALENMVRVP
ncbi:AMP-dependent synthetase [Novosphingobium malaysiense]|uniref:3-methylmercaptopropionyl-CoA ligase n=1 Tax=Novosphingobium malaysiense TaxID=1348853 RepID=A0A0B1ZF07_9SPHN|nr:AMP-dependent synthetase [Novosphingobium malaysiense]